MNERQAETLVVTLVTVTNLLIAFFISGVVIWALGEDPWFALKTLLYGAFGYEEALGYTLYYTTNFIFTGLAFAIGFHCGLFNIGAIEFIHRQIIAMRDAGKAVLLVSVELDEILSLSDRILIMFDGQIMGEILAKDANEREIGLLMAGVRKEAA